MRSKRNQLVEDFEAAVRRHAFKGAQMPEDHEAIELNYRYCKEKILIALENLRKEREA